MATKISTLNWQQTCCAWHGEYAEAKTADGAVRIKRAPDIQGYLVMRFDENNSPVDVDGDGVPDYVLMTSAEVEAIIRD